MKRTIYLGALALAALTMTNCSNDESVYSAATETQKAIGFETYATRPNQGRGLPTTGETIKTSSFGVLGYETEGEWTNATTPSFMPNQKVEWNTNRWIYNPVKLWPETKFVSFFAYAPYMNTNGIELATKAGANPKLTYTLPVGSPATMVDIVTAQAVNQKYSDETNKGTVAFTFNHILSRVGFRVKTPNIGKYVRVVLKGMTLKVEENSDLRSKATYDLYANTWDYSESARVTTTLALPGTLKAVTVDELDGYSTKAGLLLTTDKVDPFAAVSGVDNYWYLIPTNAGEDMDLSKFTVKFTYDLVTNDGSKWSCPDKQQNLTKEVTLASSTISKLALNAGKAYDFVFSIGPKVIEFAVDNVKGWGTPTDQDITVE